MPAHLTLLTVIFCLLAGASHSKPAKLHLSDAPRLIRVPLTRQSTDYTCGAAALQSILGYYGDEFREDTLAKEMATDPDKGTDYKNIARFAKVRSYKVEILHEMTLDSLKVLLDKGQPVILAIQAWPEKPVDYSTDWEDGHYVVAVGHDKDRIYFMDPSTLGNYTYIPTKQFLERWHDVDSFGNEKLIRTGIVITKGKPAYDPDAILPME
jgi:predicted double-glycine peptidase